MNSSKKYVAFSLYGQLIYRTKFLKNLEKFYQFFENYELILYVDHDLINDELKKKCQRFNVEIIKKKAKWRADGMFWRFEGIRDKSFEVYLVRDVDYEPTQLEMALIKDFETNEKSFHIVRAHQDHKMPILGGLFGIKPTLKEIFSLQLNNYTKTNFDNPINYNDDQLFLAKNIYPWVKNDSLIHTTGNYFYGEKVEFFEPEPDKIIGGDFKHIKNNHNNKGFRRIMAPVCFFNIINFRGLNFFKIDIQV